MKLRLFCISNFLIIFKDQYDCHEKINEERIGAPSRYNRFSLDEAAVTKGEGNKESRTPHDILSSSRRGGKRGKGTKVVYVCV